MVPPLSLPAPPNPAETSPRLRTLACASGGCPRCDRPVMAAALFCQPGNGDREGGGPAACVDLCARMGGRPAVRRPVSRLPGCKLGRGRGGAGPKEGSVSFWKRRLCLLQYSLRLGSVPLTDPENQTEFSLAVHVCWWASHTGTCAGPRTPPPPVFPGLRHHGHMFAGTAWRLSGHLLRSQRFGSQGILALGKTSVAAAAACV